MSLHDVVCPYCSHEFDSDDKYNADLYQEVDGEEIECPKILCKKKFMVKSWSTFNYEVMDLEEYEESGGF